MSQTTGTLPGRVTATSRPEIPIVGGLASSPLACSLREIVELFLEDCPRRLTMGREAAAAVDTRTLVRIVHSLKGSAAKFGGIDASAAEVVVEAAARADDVPPAAVAWAQLETEIAWLTAALGDWV